MVEVGVEVWFSAVGTKVEIWWIWGVLGGVLVEIEWEGRGGEVPLRLHLLVVI